MENIEKTKCLIIGSGPAGYTAAIYTARADLRPIVYEGMQPGGQLTITTDIENYPGFVDGITGPELMDNMKKQAVRLGADVRFGEATALDFSVRPFQVTIDNNKQILADRVIIATGASARWLGLASENKYKGLGVSACATCDGFFYRGKDVAIVGGGDTAAEEATYLAKMCKQVYMIVRRDVLRASKAMQAKVMNTPNIKVLFKHQTKEIVGDKFVEGAILFNELKGEDVRIDIDGFFVAIGHAPNTSIFKGQLEIDDNGYIVTKAGGTQTSVEGVFAAGDVQDYIYRQAVSASGTGCMAAIELERSLM